VRHFVLRAGAEWLVRLLDLAMEPAKKATELPFADFNAHTFEARKRRCDKIDGMTSAFSMQVIDPILWFQAESLRTAIGHIVELGVFKGRSAMLLSGHLRPDEKLILVDPESYVSDELPSMGASTKFLKLTSETFRGSPLYRELSSSVRFLHIDSSHQYRTTLAEMRMADDLLSSDGIVCLDDFTNLHYSQILPAIFKYLFTTRTNLRVFLVTNEKCYLCRKPRHGVYSYFVRQHLVSAIKRRGTSSVLSKTDHDPEYSAFYVTPKLSENEPGLYGEHIYRQHYFFEERVRFRRLRNLGSGSIDY
jgi:hypothetical protein